MKITLSGRRAHILSKLTFLSIVICTFIGDIEDRHWALKTAYWVLNAATAILVLIAWEHAFRSAPCSACSTKPRPRWITAPVILFSRYAGFPLVAAGVLVCLIGPFFTDMAASRNDTEFNWGYQAIMDTGAAVLLLFLAAVRFDRARNPGAPRTASFTHVIRERGQKLMHKAHWLYLGASGPVLVAFFLPKHGIWSSIGFGCLVLLFTAGYIDQQHGRGLCEECVTEFRTDAAEYAEARRWRFTVLHKSNWIFLLVMGAIAVSYVVPQPWRSVALGVGVVTGGVMTLFSRFHASYQPWCPYCRGGGKGSDEKAPEPVPDPSSNQPVPA
jgi:hypothetical protein